MNLSTDLRCNQYNNTLVKNTSSCVNFAALPKAQIHDVYVSCKNTKSISKSVKQFFNKLIKPFKSKTVSNSQNITLISKNFDKNGLSIKYLNYKGNDINPIEIRYINEFGEKRGMDLNSCDVGYLKYQLEKIKQSSDKEDNAVDAAITLLTPTKQIEKNIESDKLLLSGIKKLESLMINEITP